MIIFLHHLLPFCVGALAVFFPSVFALPPHKAVQIVQNVQRSAATKTKY